MPKVDSAVWPPSLQSGFHTVHVESVTTRERYTRCLQPHSTQHTASDGLDPFWLPGVALRPNLTQPAQSASATAHVAYKQCKSLVLGTGCKACTLSHLGPRNRSVHIRVFSSKLEKLSLCTRLSRTHCRSPPGLCALMLLAQLASLFRSSSSRQDHSQQLPLLPSLLEYSSKFLRLLPLLPGPLLYLLDMQQ